MSTQKEGGIKEDKERQKANKFIKRKRHQWQQIGEWVSVWLFPTEAWRRAARAAWRMELLIGSVHVGRTGANHPRRWCEATRGFCFWTEGPPLDQIIGQAVDNSLPSIVSAEGRRFSPTRPDVLHLAHLSLRLKCCRSSNIGRSKLTDSDQHHTVTSEKDRSKWGNVPVIFLYTKLNRVRRVLI